jgi:hypothetical protein
MQQLPQNTEAKRLLELLAVHYNIINGHQGINLHIKTGEDHPYCIKITRTNKMQLLQEFQDTIMQPTRWVKIAESKTKSVEELLLKVIKRHNKSCGHMLNWQIIKY